MDEIGVDEGLVPRRVEEHDHRNPVGIETLRLRDQDLEVAAGRGVEAEGVLVADLRAGGIDLVDRARDRRGGAGDRVRARVVGVGVVGGVVDRDFELGVALGYGDLVGVEDHRVGAGAGCGAADQRVGVAVVEVDVVVRGDERAGGIDEVKHRIDVGRRREVHGVGDGLEALVGRHGEAMRPGPAGCRGWSTTVSSTGG